MGTLNGISGEKVTLDQYGRKGSFVFVAADLND